jgi:hypothetical protein
VVHVQAEHARAVNGARNELEVKKYWIPRSYDSRTYGCHQVPALICFGKLKVPTFELLFPILTATETGQKDIIGSRNDHVGGREDE